MTVNRRIGRIFPQERRISEIHCVRPRHTTHCEQHDCAVSEQRDPDGREIDFHRSIAAG